MSKAIARSVCAIVLASTLAYAEKNYKDRGEFEAYDAVSKDFDAKNYAKAITDIDAWSRKYPESDFKNDRQLLLVLAYSGANQPAKTIDAGASLVAGNPGETFGKSADVLRLVYAIVSAIPHLPDPSANQMATADRAARQLIAYDKTPEGMAPDEWVRTRRDFRSAANGALLYVTLIPIVRSMKANECEAAESAAMKALAIYPDSAQLAWYLGLADVCLYKTHSEKIAPALYELARAASIDAEKGMADAKWQQATVEPYLEKLYAQYHGSDADGLKSLKVLGVQAPFPPDGFSIQSAAEIAQGKQDQFERDNPEIALWMKIKHALSAQDGPEYFASGLKDTAVPQLRGVLLAGKPECRPLELLVAVKTPESAQPLQPEITLRLSKPLAASPVPGSEIRWEGIPVAFTQTPFLLTMETEGIKSRA